MFPLFWTSKHYLEKVSKIEKNKWHNALLKCSSRKSFTIKKYFANNIGDWRNYEMLYIVKSKAWELLMVQKDLDFIFVVEKLDKILK